MQVKIINMTEDPIVTIASAFAITRGIDIEEFYRKYDSLDKMMVLITNCFESGHLSGFEFVDVDFEVLDISRVCEADSIRNRISSYEVEAGKFTEKRNFESVIPPEYKLAMDRGDIQQWELDARLDAIRDWNNTDKKIGIGPTNRRYFTNQGLSRRMRNKKNFRNMIEMCSMRLCSTAQWESRQQAQEFVKAIAKREILIYGEPFLAKFLVPKCKNLGYCPEKWESCGLYPTKDKVFEIYNKYKDGATNEGCKRI